MHDFGGRPRPGNDYGFYSGTGDGFHSYGSYLARHALALTGGALLLERPVVGDSYENAPWEDWLSRYSPTRSDGLWLWDGTRQYPSYTLHDLLRGNAQDQSKDVPTTDGEFIRSLAGVSATNTISEHLIVDADWNSPDKVDVAITSVLTARAESRTVALAVATATPFQAWLPALEEHEEEEDDPRLGRVDMSPCEPWVTNRSAEIKLDDRDGFGAKSAVHRSRPSKHIIDMFGLTSNDVWSETWNDEDGRIAFRSIAFGSRWGTGEREVWDQGKALSCDRSFLARMLTALNRDLVLLVKLQHFRERPAYESASGSFDTFSHSIVVVTVAPSLEVRVVVPSDAEIEAVNALPKRDRTEFKDRYRVIKNLVAGTAVPKVKTSVSKRTRRPLKKD